MRLMTYNIHKGVGTDRRYRLERVVAVIAAEAPDLICLQEVDRNCRRSRHDDQPALLAERLGAAAWEYQLNAPHGEGGYGPNLSANPLLTQTSGLLSIVRNGRGKMPAEGDTWTPAQLQALAVFLRTHVYKGASSGG